MTILPLQLFNLQVFIYFFNAVSELIYKKNQLQETSVISNTTLIDVIIKVFFVLS
jgi:hypothetical protein